MAAFVSVLERASVESPLFARNELICATRSASEASTVAAAAGWATAQRIVVAKSAAAAAREMARMVPSRLAMRTA